MDYIDLRSDTVTWPTPAMRKAMADAPVGDDVYGEDPTINRLEKMAAEKLRKEAALFVASGTMGNITALMTHCGRGERAIMGKQAHTHLYEAGNPATLGGIQSWTVPVQPDGTLKLSDIEDGISIDDPHFPVTRLVALENAQGSMGGQPLPPAYIQQVGDFCYQNNLKLHIDGARFFNAAIASGTDASTLAAPADSVSFCLSKGLCAPAGSMLVGSEDFIYRARRIRKVLGGGMRQAGILAAAGIVALEEMVERLEEDHVMARMLAEGLADIPGIEIEPEQVKTNMMFFRLREDARLNARELADKLLMDDIRMSAGGVYEFRAVTHYWIRPEHVEKALRRIRFYLS